MKNFRFYPISSGDLCGYVNYVHNGTPNYTTAYEINEKANIKILLPRILGVVSIDVEILDESLSSIKSVQNAEWTDLEEGFDAYEIPINSYELARGLYYFRFIVKTVYGNFYGYRKGRELYLTEKDTGEYFQLTICESKYKAATKKLGGVIYHIFVDRFNRCGEVEVKEGAKVVDSWTQIPEYPAYPGAPLKNNCFYGGTLYGIIDKLDYIASLGVNIIYLSPIFDAASNHKYDTADYMTVDKMFGGEVALKSLLDEAHKRGISIILDGVFNHTGSDSIYFNREGNYPSVGAYQSKESIYYPWFDFQIYPDKYTCWWGIDILPRINTAKQEVCDFIAGDGGVVDTYSKMGVDGFRLDVADELPDEFIARIKATSTRYNEDNILYGEVWEDASNKIAYDTRKKYYLGDELDGVMNYPIRTGIIEYLNNGRTDALYYALTTVTDNAPKRVRDMQMNLLGTHDTERIITVLGGESPAGRSNTYLATKRMTADERKRAIQKLKIAYTIIATLPGIPAIFYGDEAGLEGYQDPFNRMPFPWGREDRSLLRHYKTLGAIRNKYSVYKSGEFSLLYLDRETVVFSREGLGKTYVTVVNNSPKKRGIVFSSVAKPLISKGSGEELKLEGYSAEIYEIDAGESIELLDI